MKLMTMSVLLLLTSLEGAESLADRLSEDKNKLEKAIVVDKTDPRSAEQKRIDELARTPRPIDGISVKVAEMNLSRKTTVDFQYAPPLKEGAMIDNEEKATVNVNIKF